MSSACYMTCFLRCVFDLIVDCGRSKVVAIFLLLRRVLVQGGTFHTENACRHLGFETNVAVVHRLEVTSRCCSSM